MTLPMDERLTALLKRGKDRGYLTYSEVNDYLPDEILNEEEFDHLLLLLEQHQIELRDEEPDAAEQKSKSHCLMAEDQIASGDSPELVPISDLLHTEMQWRYENDFRTDAVLCPNCKTWCVVQIGPWPTLGRCSTCSGPLEYIPPGIKELQEAIANQPDETPGCRSEGADLATDGIANEELHRDQGPEPEPIHGASVGPDDSLHLVLPEPGPPPGERDNPDDALHLVLPELEQTPAEHGSHNDKPFPESSIFHEETVKNEAHEPEPPYAERADFVPDSEISVVLTDADLVKAKPKKPAGLLGRLLALEPEKPVAQAVALKTPTPYLFLRCPHCPRMLHAPPEATGKFIRCPMCGGDFLVPEW